MKILITGGSGFIGTNLVSFFIKSHDVLNIDINEPKIKQHLQYWVNIDINDYDRLNIAVQDFNPDYIIHLAARTDLKGSSVDDYSSNVKGVENIVNVAKQIKSLKKIIITSSMLVCHVGYIPKDDFDYSATTFYGKSKVETEKITWNAHLTCDWAIIRPTSIWGPWFDVPYKSFFEMVKSHTYFHIGNKGCSKTYGYIGNSVYQIERILMSDTTDICNKVFYIGETPAINIKEWANQISNLLGSKVYTIPWVFIKCAAYLGDILKYFRLPFPMTSFRLKNMTTDNIVNLERTYKIAPNPPYERIEAIKETLKWMERTEQ